MEKNEEIRLRFFSLGERENGKHCRISMSVSKWRDFSTPLNFGQVFTEAWYRGPQNMEQLGD